MRIVFCGSGEFGIPTLQQLVDKGVDLPLVLTQPPRPAGRGGQLRPTPLAQEAGHLGLAVRAVEDINAPEVVETLGQLRAELLLVVDFGQMIRLPARQAFAAGAINLHGSLLPELRGAAPVNWAIIRGCRTTGVTTFQIVDRMDAGAMYHRRQTEIDPRETALELRHRLSELGAEAVLETLAALEAGELTGQEQDETRATKAPRLKKSDGSVNWCDDAVAVRNRIHGTWPWPGGQSGFVPTGGKCLPVTIARAAAHEPDQRVALPGLVLGDLTVACGLGRLEILEIKPAGGRLMQWRDFCNGHHVKSGDTFLATT